MRLYYASFAVVALSAFACGNTIVDQTTSSSSSTTSNVSSTAAGVNTDASVGTNTGSGGAGGAIVVTGGTGGASMTSGNGGAGGKANCEQGCAKAENCFGADVCSEAGINCGMLNSQEQCVADCFNSPMTTCNNAQDCLNSCTMATTTGTMASTGTGVSMACTTCFGTSCGTEAITCGKDMTSGCPEWIQCVKECNDSACATMCDTMYPNAKSEYEPLYACACTSCMTQCGSIDPCNH